MPRFRTPIPILAMISSLVAATMHGCGPSPQPGGTDGARQEHAAQPDQAARGDGAPTGARSAASSSGPTSRAVGSAPRVPDAAPAPRPNRPRGYSLHIGVDDYLGDEDDLTKAVKDARDLRRAFEDMGFDSQLLPNPRSRDEIMSAVRDVARRADSSQSVIVTFSGHGWGERLPGPNGTVEDHDFLCPGNYAGPGDGVGTRELQDALNGSDASGAALIIDACRTGSLLSTITQTRSFRELRSTGTTKVLMFYGTQAGMVSVEDPITDQFGDQISNGWFSHFIIKVIRDRAMHDSDSDGVFSFEEMADQVSRHMMELSQRNDKARYQVPFWDSQLSRISIRLDDVDPQAAVGSPMMPGSVAHTVRGIVEGEPSRIGRVLAAEFATGGRLSDDNNLREELFKALTAEVGRAFAALLRSPTGLEHAAARERLLQIVQGSLALETGSARILEGLAVGATDREMVSQIDRRLEIADVVSGLPGADHPDAMRILSNLAGAHARWLIDVGDEARLGALFERSRNSRRAAVVEAIREGMPRLWRMGRPAIASRLFEKYGKDDPQALTPPELLAAAFDRHLQGGQCDRAAEVLQQAFDPDRAYLDEERERLRDHAASSVLRLIEGRTAATPIDARCLTTIGTAGGESLREEVVPPLRKQLGQLLAASIGAREALACLELAEAIRGLDPASTPLTTDQAATLALALVRSWPASPTDRDAEPVRRLATLTGDSPDRLIESGFDAAAASAVRGALNQGATQGVESASAWITVLQSLGVGPQQSADPAIRALADRLMDLAPTADSLAQVRDFVTIASALHSRAPEHPALADLPVDRLTGTTMGAWGATPAAADAALIRRLAELTGNPTSELVAPHFPNLADRALDAASSPRERVRAGVAWARLAASLEVPELDAWSPVMTRARAICQALVTSLGPPGSEPRRADVDSLAPLLERDRSLREVVSTGLLARGQSALSREDLPVAVGEFRSAIDFGADPALVDAALIPPALAQGLAESDEGIERTGDRLLEVARAGWRSDGMDQLLESVLRRAVDRNLGGRVGAMMGDPATGARASQIVGAIALDMLPKEGSPGSLEGLRQAWDLRAYFADLARQRGVTFAVDANAIRSALGTIQPRGDEEIGVMTELLDRAVHEQILTRPDSHPYWRRLLEATRIESHHANNVVEHYLVSRNPDSDSYPPELGAKVVNTLFQWQRWEEALTWFERCGSPVLPPDARQHIDRLVYLRDLAASWKSQPLSVMLLDPVRQGIRPTRVDLALAEFTGLTLRLTPLVVRWPAPTGGRAGCPITGRIDPWGIHLDICGESLSIGPDHGSDETPELPGGDSTRLLADGWSIRRHATGQRESIVALAPRGSLLLSTLARTSGLMSPRDFEHIENEVVSGTYQILGGRIAFDLLNACYGKPSRLGVGTLASDRALRLRGALVLTDNQRARLEANRGRSGNQPSELLVEVRVDSRAYPLSVSPSRPVALIDIEVPRGTQYITFVKTSEFPGPAVNVIFADLRLLGLP